MRKGAIYFLIVLAVVVGVVLYFFRDRYLERALESACESANGAKVEFDNFHFSLLRLTCKFDRLQWTDPKDTWTNLFETGPVEFGLELRPLFWKKFIIREAKISGILLGTKRTTNGWIPAPPEEPGLFDEIVKSVEQEIKALPVLNLEALKQKVNLDSLLDVDRLAVVQSVQAIRGEIDTTGAKWQQFIKTYDAQAKITALQTRVRAIDLQNLKTVDDFTTNLQQVNKLRDEAVVLRNETANTRKNFEQDFGRIAANIKNLDNLAEQDFAAAKQKLGFAEFNIKDVGKMLFGNPFAGRFNQVMRYLDLGREYLPTAQKLMAVNKVQKPPRFKGQDIPFPRTFAHPKFLLRHALISGATNAVPAEALQLKGEVWGITSQPPVYGKPTILELQAFKEESNAYQVRGVLDHVTEVANDTLYLRAGNFRLGTVDLKPGQRYLPASFLANRGEVNAMFALSGKTLHSRVDMQIDKVAFQFAEAAADSIVETIRGVFRPMEQLRLLVEVQGPSNALQLHIGSNLDEIFAARVREVLKAGLDRAQQEISRRIHQEATRRRQQVEALLEEKQKPVRDELNKYQAMIEEQLAVIENKKKEIEKRIKEEQERATGETKKKLKKALEGLRKP
ncbi:MAG: TIGR03545 family protein [candidate division KSB1 bacterium]|nr:TIGR03545 family protein [candidate division KSB1 bacterium]MDZ7313985.1 TIGR03545 family protein [candidate division KSB1 bacterium]